MPKEMPEKKMHKKMTFDGLQRVTKLPLLDVWLAQRLARQFPPIDCATAARLAAAGESDTPLPPADARALLWHLIADGPPHAAACPHGKNRPETLLDRLRAQADLG